MVVQKQIFSQEHTTCNICPKSSYIAFLSGFERDVLSSLGVTYELILQSSFNLLKIFLVEPCCICQKKKDNPIEINFR